MRTSTLLESAQMRLTVLVGSLLLGTPSGTAARTVSQELPVPDEVVRFQPPTNQLSLASAAKLDFTIAYARQVADSRFAFGGAIGFAWEMNNHNLDRNVWEAGHVEMFGRYHISESFVIEAGPTVMTYSWTDDCSSCTGSFVGLRSGVFFGYRFFFIGYTARLGTARDDQNGSGFGVIHTPEVRFVISWG